MKMIIVLDVMDVVCQDEYVERGFDSPEQCINHEMGRAPDC